ncbi:MAG: crossover junction endodeoxyribonuclease RuvC [Candidatus Spechtbacterales bacterium]|nr:crossover junction endodeoxyribonuclease RuvC [Candidatus Spechtbacterales bacterium]
MGNSEKIILGIDPGTATMGYGVIRFKNQEIESLEYGALTTEAGIPEHIRLKDLYGGLGRLIKKHSPDVVAIEDIFYFKNKKTVIKVSQARGAALLAAANSGKECYSFTPLQIKQAVAGWGQADKKQVQDMVKKLLNLKEIPKPDDAADALAVAICCAYSLSTLSAIDM